MRAPKSPSERYLSERILFFAYLMCSSVSGAKALKKKTCLRFAIFNFSEKLQNIFEKGLRKCGLIVQKSFLKKKYFEIKKFGDMALLFICKISYCQNLRAIELIPFDL